MDPAWASVPLYVSGGGSYLALHGNYQVTVWRPSGPTPPPSSLALSPEDMDFRDSLVGAFDSMNAEVAASLASTRNAPVPLPPASGSKAFWRIKADWGVDSDLDGSPDWLEFEVLGNPTHPFHALANPFDGDVDLNGQADGTQLDADLDGRPDAQDVLPSDSTFNQPVAALPRYALFPINSAHPPSADKAPLQINNRGRVLYLNGTWSAGDWKLLETENQQHTLTGAKARSMNDLDEIVGSGNYRVQADPVIESSHVAYWTAPNAKPAPLTNGNMFAANPSIEFVFPIDGYRAAPFLSNDGQMIVNACDLRSDPPDTPARVLRLPGNNRYIWTLPKEGRSSTHIEVEGGMTYIHDEQLYWGWDVADNTKGSYPALLIR